MPGTLYGVSPLVSSCQRVVGCGRFEERQAHHETLAMTPSLLDCTCVHVASLTNMLNIHRTQQTRASKIQSLLKTIICLAIKSW